MLNKKGIPPIIGVVLMTSITVIFAAVIAAFVYGESQNFEKSVPPSAWSGEYLIVDKGFGDSAGFYVSVVAVNDSLNRQTLFIDGKDTPRTNTNKSFDLFFKDLHNGDVYQITATKTYFLYNLLGGDYYWQIREMDYVPVSDLLKELRK